MFATVFVHRDEIAAVEFVHLAITVDAFGSVVFAGLRADEHLVGHGVEQIAQLLFLQRCLLHSHE